MSHNAEQSHTNQQLREITQLSPLCKQNLTQNTGNICLFIGFNMSKSNDERGYKLSDLTAQILSYVKQQFDHKIKFSDASIKFTKNGSECYAIFTTIIFETIHHLQYFIDSCKPIIEIPLREYAATMLKLTDEPRIIRSPNNYIKKYEISIVPFKDITLTKTSQPNYFVQFVLPVNYESGLPKSKKRIPPQNKRPNINIASSEKHTSPQNQHSTSPHNALLSSFTQSAQQLALEQLEQGKLYPRPAGECAECNMKIILCYGPNVQPYWRHVHDKHKEKPDHSPSNGETLTHYYAKTLLQKYLNQKYSCVFAHPCNKTTIHIPPSTSPFRTEYPYKNCIWDLVGFNSDSTISFGIEILHTHKTGSTKNRDDIPWVEVKADEVLRLLDTNNPSKEITLIDHRLLSCCLHNIPNISPSLSLRQIALQLDYAREVPRYDIQTTQILVAQTGLYHSSTYWSKPHSITLSPAERTKLQNEIVKRKQCICCEKSYESTRDKPYCIMCYSNYVDKTSPQHGTMQMSKRDRQNLIHHLQQKYYLLNEKNYDFGNEGICEGNGECFFLSLNKQKDVICHKNDAYQCDHKCIMRLFSKQSIFKNTKITSIL